MEKASIIIPSFNGLELLKRNLPSLVEAKKYVSNKMDVEIIVVDDGSSDNSVDFVTRNFPVVKVLHLTGNTGFAHACNAGAKFSKGEVLIFLNNDVRVEQNFIAPLLTHFKKQDIFAVAAKSITSKDWLYNESVSQAYFEKGIFTLVHPQRNKKNDFLDKPRPILYPCGAAFACRRNIFLKLGGFDELYAPFFWEDVDIGYRGWKRGWEVLYEPVSLVHHIHRQTISKVVSNSYAEMIFLRNSFIFTWKNITSPKMFYSHLYYLSYRLCLSLLQYRFMDFAAFVSALKRLPEIFKKRKLEKREMARSDEEVLRMTWLG